MDEMNNIEISKLKKLLNSGILTDEEYNEQKEIILNTRDSNLESENCVYELPTIDPIKKKIETNKDIDETVVPGQSDNISDKSIDSNNMVVTSKQNLDKTKDDNISAIDIDNTSSTNQMNINVTEEIVQNDNETNTLKSSDDLSYKTISGTTEELVDEIQQGDDTTSKTQNIYSLVVHIVGQIIQWFFCSCFLLAAFVSYVEADVHIKPFVCIAFIIQWFSTCPAIWKIEVLNRYKQWRKVIFFFAFVLLLYMMK